MSVPPDVELIAEAQTGHREAFAELINRHQGRAFAQALGQVGDPHEAEEIVQEALVRAWQHLGSLRDPDAFPGWLGSIVSRIATDHFRSRRHPKPFCNSGVITPTSLDEEESQRLWEAVRDLQPDYRTAFLLVHLEGLSYRDVAEQLGVPVSTVEGRVYKAKQILRGKVRTS